MTEAQNHERFGRYLLLHRIAIGGMAEIFLALPADNPDRQQLLVIKRIRDDLCSDESFVEMFIDEARLVSRLAHSNIIKLYEFGQVDGRYFIALEHVWGESLRTMTLLCTKKKMRFPLGAALYIHLGAVGLSFSLLGVAGASWFALLGALGAIALVYGLTRTRHGFSTATLLLAGVAVSFFFSSLILFLQYVSDPTRTFRMLRWVMGGLDRVVGFGDVLGVLPFAVAGCLMIFYLTHELNLITTGDELAAARGVEVNRTKLLVFFASSLMVGAVVAICGPIGFVGLMAPHICRLLIGPDHRYLTPATILFGGAFLVVCDTLARTVMAPTELPVGIITALLGGPFFLWLLLRRSSETIVA